MGTENRKLVRGKGEGRKFQAHRGRKKVKGDIYEILRTREGREVPKISQVIC